MFLNYLYWFAIILCAFCGFPRTALTPGNRMGLVGWGVELLLFVVIGIRIFPVSFPDHA